MVHKGIHINNIDKYMPIQGLELKIIAKIQKNDFYGPCDEH